MNIKCFHLGVTFDSSLTFSDHISSVSKSCFLSTRDLRRIRNTLDYSTARIIATSLIHSLSHSFQGRLLQLYFSRSSSMPMVAFNLLSTLQLELFLKPLASAISQPSSNLYTGLKSINASSKKLYLWPTKHCKFKNLHISTIVSTIKLTSLLFRLLLSLFNVPQSTFVSD